MTQDKVHNMKSLKIVQLLAAISFLTLALLTTLFPIQPMMSPSLTAATVILLGAIGFIFMLRVLTMWVANLSNRLQTYILIGIVVIILLTQLIVALNFVDYGRADSFFVRNQAAALANNTKTWNHYFQIYTNNINLALFEGQLVKLAQLLHFSNPWVLINILQFLWIDTALFAGFKILQVWHLAALKISYAVVWLLTVPVYAYGVFIYSDSLVLPIPIVTMALYLWWYQQVGYKKLIPTGLIGANLIFGAVIKPNMIVVMIAFGIALLIDCFRKQMRWKTAITWIVGIVVCLVLIGNLMTMRAKSAGYKSDSNQALPATSWIAMSLNTKMDGKYDYADVHYQMKLPTRQQKITSEKTIIQNRIKRMGVIGLINHFGKKVSVFLSSGMFGGFNLTNQWETEPNWYLQHESSINYRLSVWAQMLYTAILINCALLFFNKRKNRNNYFLMFFVLGLAAFHIVFWEVEARYALPLLPVFILWANVGQADTVFVNSEILHKVRLKYVLVALTSLLLVGAGYREAQIHSNSIIIAEQGNGSYFNNLKQRLEPSKSVTTKIFAQTENSALKLQPFARSDSLVRIVIKKNGRVLRIAIGNANQLKRINYGKQSAGTLRLTIQNIGMHPISYGDAISNYPIGKYHIDGNKDKYLRYYVLLNTRA